ncbi:HesA/MoeB/ThiF family protein [Cytobacillus sp. FSL K6-0265]|uniref:HesA/MoeB/ThiF family protein n=1 Tax=Cytobacillus sp. FSL K6-0265 TaxID=2921448 RepID=UPI0030FBE65E
MSSKRVPSDSLLKGRRAIEFINGIELINDLDWREPISKWVLHCCLYSDEIEASVIPRSTEWYVLIDDNYPMGSISIYPSKKNSINVTFPHQMYNGEGYSDHPWRSGLLCLDTNVRTLGNLAPSEEPFQDEMRLAWYISRAIEWLIAASRNKLTLKDEPFEMVDFPEWSSLKVGFSETTQSFRFWNSKNIKFGLATFSILNCGIFLVRGFKQFNGVCLRNVNWGYYPTDFKSNDRILGSWILLNEMPHFKPWQAPSTWGELTKICREQGIDLGNIMKQVKKKQSYKNKLVHILLIGFPIKRKINEEFTEIFWKGIEIPLLKDNSLIPKININGNKKNNHKINVNGRERIRWMRSYNWAKKAVMSRGMLPESISESKILIIGAGALGSSIGELLTRAGVEKLGIIDYDILEMGNLTRHNLLVTDLGRSKVESLANRLNKTSVHSKVAYYSGTLKDVIENNMGELKKYRVILDCTGEDEVLEYLQQYQWPTTKQFISISLGYGGKRLYTFSNCGSSFRYDLFRKVIDPWLQEEKSWYEETELPREGLGCWHPLFPARIDDVWIMAATAVKRLEIIYRQRQKPLFSVYEQNDDNGTFSGLDLINNEVCDE